MYKNDISPKIRTMVQKINEVGLTEIIGYCDRYRPRTNLRRQLKIVRAVAKNGYAGAGCELGITRQAAECSLKRVYGIALAVEALKSGK